MSDHAQRCLQIKTIMVDELMMDLAIDEIDDDMALMGPDSLELDSVDALQLVVALEKHFGLVLADAEAAKKVLLSVNAISNAVAEHQAAGDT